MKKHGDTDFQPILYMVLRWGKSASILEGPLPYAEAVDIAKNHTSDYTHAAAVTLDVVCLVEPD